MKNSLQPGRVPPLPFLPCYSARPSLMTRRLKKAVLCLSSPVLPCFNLSSLLLSGRKFVLLSGSDAPILNIAQADQKLSVVAEIQSMNQTGDGLSPILFFYSGLQHSWLLKLSFPGFTQQDPHRVYWWGSICGQSPLTPTVRVPWQRGFSIFGANRSDRTTRPVVFRMQKPLRVIRRGSIQQ